MKEKFLITAFVTIVFGLFILMLIGCGENPETVYNRTDVNSTNQEKLVIHYEPGLKHPMKVIEFNYKDHKYIMFRSSHPVIVHNPDCECLHKKDNKTSGGYLDW